MMDLDQRREAIKGKQITIDELEKLQHIMKGDDFSLTVHAGGQLLLRIISGDEGIDILPPKKDFIALRDALNELFPVESTITTGPATGLTLGSALLRNTKDRGSRNAALKGLYDAIELLTALRKEIES